MPVFWHKGASVDSQSALQELHAGLDQEWLSSQFHCEELFEITQNISTAMDISIECITEDGLSI